MKKVFYLLLLMTAFTLSVFPVTKTNATTPANCNDSEVGTSCGNGECVTLIKRECVTYPNGCTPTCIPQTTTTYFYTSMPS